MIKPIEAVNSTKDHKSLMNSTRNYTLKVQANTTIANATVNQTSNNKTANKSQNSSKNSLNDYTKKINLIMNSFANDLSNLTLAQKIDKKAKPSNVKNVKAKLSKDSTGAKDMVKDVEK